MEGSPIDRPDRLIVTSRSSPTSAMPSRITHRSISPIMPNSSATGRNAAGAITSPSSRSLSILSRSSSRTTLPVRASTIGWLYSTNRSSLRAVRTRRSHSYASTLASSSASRRLRSVMSRVITETPTVSPSTVPDRRRAHRDVDQGAVLVPPLRLVVVHPLPREDLLDDRLVLAGMRRRDDQLADVHAAGLLRGEAVEPFRARIPARHGAVWRARHDRVVRGLDDLRQQLPLPCRLAKLAHEPAQAILQEDDQGAGHEHRADHQQPPELVVAERHEGVGDRDQRALEQRAPDGQEIEGVKTRPEVQDDVGAGGLAAEPDAAGDEQDAGAVRDLDARHREPWRQRDQNHGGQIRAHGDQRDAGFVQLVLVRQSQRRGGQRRPGGEHRSADSGDEREIVLGIQAGPCAAALVVRGRAHIFRFGCRVTWATAGVAWPPSSAGPRDIHHYEYRAWRTPPEIGLDAAQRSHRSIIRPISGISVRFSDTSRNAAFIVIRSGQIPALWVGADS